MRTQKYWLNGCSFDVRSGELSNGETTRRLEPKAAAVLAALCDHEGEVVSRDALLDRGWGEGGGSDEALTQAIAQIRRSLDELGAGEVETLSKRGYRLKAAAAAAKSSGASRAKTASPLIWLLSLVAAVLVIMAIVSPHALRHAVRHTLGLGPPQAG